MLVIRQLSRQDYLPVWRAMQRFTDDRNQHTADEIWLVEHSPVYTQGQAGKPEHILAPGNIPVVQADRGGQVTYHGPGQLVAYLLLDLRRLGLGVRQLVDIIEQSIIAVLAGYEVAAMARSDAPGVYIADQGGGMSARPDEGPAAGAKIAALGLRVRKGCTFHGLALNIDLDLEPFTRINPCGYAGQNVTRLKDLVVAWPDGERRRIELALVTELTARLGYPRWQQLSGLPSVDNEVGE